VIIRFARTTLKASRYHSRVRRVRSARGGVNHSPLVSDSPGVADLVAAFRSASEPCCPGTLTHLIQAKGGWEPLTSAMISASSASLVRRRSINRGYAGVQEAQVHRQLSATMCQVAQKPFANATYRGSSDITRPCTMNRHSFIKCSSVAQSSAARPLAMASWQFFRNSVFFSTALGVKSPAARRPRKASPPSGSAEFSMTVDYIGTGPRVAFPAASLLPALEANSVAARRKMK
jgi:hypothetical protein